MKQLPFSLLTALSVASLLGACAPLPAFPIAGFGLGAVPAYKTYKAEDHERLLAGQPAQYTSTVVIFDTSKAKARKGQTRAVIGGATVTECSSSTFPLARELVPGSRYMTVSRTHGLIVIGPLAGECEAPAGAQTLPLVGQAPLTLPGQTSTAVVDVQPFRPSLADASGTGGTF